MRIILLLTFLTLQLFATNPKIYAALGDKLYNNINSINKLKEIREFNIYKSKIQEYYYDVNAVKSLGLLIDEGSSKLTRKDYLKKLRKLSKTNDFFIQSVNMAYHKSIKNEDSELFLEMVNSGLLDTKRYKKDIKKYYYSHRSELDISGTIIEKFAKEDKKNKKKIYKGATKEQLQKAKIERIRAKDRAKQEAIAKSIEDELLKKKRKIREEQKKELRTK